jgi:hypothetical protein
MYSRMSEFAFKRVMLNPGPFKLVMYAPDTTELGLIFLSSVEHKGF